MKYLVFVLTVLVNIVAIMVSYYSFEISFANASASNILNQNLKFSSSENLKEVSNKTNGEDPNSSIRRSVSSVSENLNPNRFPQSLTMGIFGLKPISSEQILCISFFGKRSEEELTEQDMRAIKAVLKVEDEIKLAPLTRAEATDSSTLLQVEVKALYESKLRELLLKGISKELFERVRRKILDESKDSTQSEQSGVSARDQVLEENQKQYKEKLEWAKLILAKYGNEDPNLKNISFLIDKREVESLRRSIKEGKNDLLEALLVLGLDPNKFDLIGHTALIAAVDYKNYEAVDLLLRYGVNVNEKSAFRSTSPLLLALSEDRLNILELLLSYKPNLEIRNASNTPFLISAYLNSLKILKLLKEAGADIFALSLRNNGNALHEATNFKDARVEVVEWLIAQGLDINQVDISNKTPFMYSVENGNIDVMKLLIRKGVNVNQTDIDGTSAFHMFIRLIRYRDFLESTNKAKQMIPLLLENGWNPFLKSSVGTSRFYARNSIKEIENEFNNELLKAELAYIEKNGLDNIQELNDTEKSYYRYLIKELDLAKTSKEKEKIIKRAAREDPRMGVQK